MSDQPPRPIAFFDIPKDQLPEAIRVDPAVHHALQQAVEAGREPNDAQLELIVQCVRYCAQQRIPLPPLYAAATLLAFRAQTTVAEADQRLRDKLEKAERLQTLAAQIQHARETRQQAEAARLAASQNGRAPSAAMGDPTACIARMKQALSQKNLDHAVSVGSEAAAAFPRFPEILFTAGMCYLRRAANGPESTLFLRVQDLRQSVRLLGECLAIANDPQRTYFAKWKSLASPPLAQAQSALLHFETTLQEEEEQFRRHDQTRAEQERLKGKKTSSPRSRPTPPPSSPPDT